MRKFKEITLNFDVFEVHFKKQLLICLQDDQ